MTDKDILNKIQSYNYIKATKEELEEQLQSIVYKSTQSYGELGGMAGGSSSKVERHAMRKMELEDKISKAEAQLREIEGFISHKSLNQTEQEVLRCIADCEHLISYARYNKMCLSNVYKVRDRALKKIARG